MRLYVLPGACSLASHIALEVAADAHESEPAGPRPGFDVIVVQRGRQREPDYLAINPRGTVPALVTREGDLVVESLAVLLHIADQCRRPASRRLSELLNATGYTACCPSW